MPVAPNLSNFSEFLPGARFADRFAVVVSGQRLDVMTATGRAFADRPAWIGRLMALRNLLVRPFGLKTAVADLPSQQRRIGMFPLLSQTASRIVLGLDDRHLDFRLVVELKELGEGLQEVSATTLVAPHNWFGRAYLAVIMPFHRIIVPAMLARVAGPQG
ncbi:Protein of unknown function [Mesorhizobium albiziae]|uniref:DUF2867 domain-containing protein n=1 Tax=Neomesorhizobium albiziae TaxID=335020 RepID=A0A1I3Y257_9HYPH|nr:DUF2867 domain-containing protein [Mesorhizobium albiziae]GLS30186.1 hypothetical protein GCM10007937_18940 [Mesorhizobium albiziae]SFK25346.1 Protein of unknown function [Mesorhizobium albiziae]